MVKDQTGLFSCPQLVSADPTLSLQINMDPTYYGYSTCTCERGYTSGGLPPKCAAFPSLISFNTSMGGVFSDGASSGRLRTGADTQWVVSPPGDFRAINIILTLNNPFLSSTNGSGTKNDGYQISVTNGTFSLNM